ncbi:MAG: ASKHA domain-containing protein [Anaerolineae bacterium]
MDYYQIEFEPVGRRGLCRSDETLLEAARQLGVDLISLCGGVGVCERCKVQILAGRVSELSSVEREALSQKELEDGYRLACMTFPLDHCKLGVPPESLSTPLRTQVEGVEIEVPLAPSVRSLGVQLDPPSLLHPQADAENLLLRINQSPDVDAQVVDIGLLRELSDKLRAWDWHCNAHVHGQEVIAISRPGSRSLGMAVDLGSTKIAGYLVDLQDGKTLAAEGLMNPQINYGEDIVSRITYAMKSAGGREKIRQSVIEALNRLAEDLCAEIDATPEEILEAVVVGNTAMHHLFLGLPVQQLALAPFVPTVSAPLDLKARDIGLDIAAGAYVHMPPNIAGYIGSDHVAMLMAIADEWSEQCVLALDIGTNTEISLIAPGRGIISVSCASGPAFEGYHIQDGTRATRGAIERVLITADEVYYQTIEGAPATGICGSGILDAVAQLHLAGVLTDNGRIRTGSHARVRQDGSQPEFVLVSKEGRKEIRVTQDDVREIQLAKAAIQTGIQVLVAESGVRVQEIDKVVIAGAFGSYIDVPNAVAMGMFPLLPPDRFKQVGNAAGMGARMALLSTRIRSEARELCSHINYIELASYPGFSRVFARSCQLGPYVQLL